MTTAMPPPNDSWTKLWDVFHDARALEGEARAAFIRTACADDSALKAEVEKLLAGLDNAASFMERPPQIVPDVVGADDEMGADLGRYQIQRLVGEGGMGLVYEARQTEPIQRQVAIKLIKPGNGSQEILARFENERQAMALMTHPGIAQVYDAGLTEDGRPFFVMEYIDGIAIDAYCDSQRLSIQARLRLFSDVCAAVAHAHQKGVIHRDIKPSNILVFAEDADPRVKVIDFGIAKAIQSAEPNQNWTSAGRVIGTRGYMSPEQSASEGADVDTRTDVFALGVLLDLLISG
ncbi:MAG: serine/threonine-protein kinase, partial [Pseudomonadota bacterium]